jgi:hypothetical protein
VVVLGSRKVGVLRQATSKRIVWSGMFAQALQ